VCEPQFICNRERNGPTEIIADAVQGHATAGYWWGNERAKAGDFKVDLGCLKRTWLMWIGTDGGDSRRPIINHIREGDAASHLDYQVTLRVAEVMYQLHVRVLSADMGGHGMQQNEALQGVFEVLLAMKAAKLCCGNGKVKAQPAGKVGPATTMDALVRWAVKHPDTAKKLEWFVSAKSSTSNTVGKARNWFCDDKYMAVTAWIGNSAD